MNGQNQTLVNHLRNAVRNLQNISDHYHDLYTAERNEKEQVNNRLQNLQDEHQDLQEENETLQENLESEKYENSKYKIPRVYKSWSQLKSANVKRKRKVKFRRCLSHVLKNLPDVKNATISLNMGTEHISFTCSERDIADPESIGIQTHPPTHNNDHNYIRPDENEETGERVFDDSNQFVKKHVRKVIFIMDRFKFPQEGYHEMRKACNALMPPISQVKKEKKKMSTDIPYTVHPTVRV